MLQTGCKIELKVSLLSKMVEFRPSFEFCDQTVGLTDQRPVLYSEPIFLDRIPYRSLGQNLVSVPIPNQFILWDLEPISYRSRSLTSRYRTSFIPCKKVPNQAASLIMIHCTRKKVFFTTKTLIQSQMNIIVFTMEQLCVTKGFVNSIKQFHQ